MNITSICAGSQAMPTSEEMRALTELWKRLWTVILSHVWYPTLITSNPNGNWSGMKALTNCMTFNHPWGNIHRFIQEVSRTKWSLVTAILVTCGWHMLSYSRQNLAMNVLDVSHHCQSNTSYWAVWILWSCTNNFMLQTGCKEIFIKVKEENILAFLRAAGLYHLI